MKKSKLISLIKQIIRESTDDVGKFHQDLQSQIKGKIHSSPKSDYAKGDEIFTITGAPVIFVSDLLPDKKTGNRRALIKTRDGSTTSISLNNLLPESPTAERALSFLATKYSNYNQFADAAMRRGYDENDGIKKIWNDRKKS